MQWVNDQGSISRESGALSTNSLWILKARYDLLDLVACFTTKNSTISQFKKFFRMFSLFLKNNIYFDKEFKK